MKGLLFLLSAPLPQISHLTTDLVRALIFFDWVGLPVSEVISHLDSELEMDFFQFSVGPDLINAWWVCIAESSHAHPIAGMSGFQLSNLGAVKRKKKRNQT